MFTLPFYVDSPLPAAFFTLAVASVLAFFWLAHACRWSAGRPLKWFFARWLYTLGPERAQRAGRLALAVLIGVFLSITVFGFIVGSGLIKNGQPPPTMSMDEFVATHSKSSQ